MRSRQLSSFITICELGSISRAAERLHVAQPALGLQVRGLEEEMGAQLLERHSRGVQPTAAGELVLAWARDAVLRMHDVKEQLRDMSARLSGTLSLGLTPSIATAFALPILTAVERELPNLHLHLIEGNGQFLRQWIGTGKIDLALVFDSPDAPASADTTLLSERLYFISKFDGANAEQGPISMTDLVERPLAMPAAGDAVRSTVENAARSLDLPLHFEYEVQSIGVILSIVQAGMASTVLPMPMVLSKVREGVLSARRIVAPELVRHLQWIHSANPNQPRVTEDLQRKVYNVLRDGSDSALMSEAYTFNAGR